MEQGVLWQLLDSASRLVNDVQWQTAFRNWVMTPANPNLTVPARNLLRTLYALQGTGIINGQHDYLESPDEFSNKLKTTGGQYAGLHGYELGAINNQRPELIRSQRDGVVASAIRWYQSGGIVALTYHAHLPGTAPAWSNVSMNLSNAEFDKYVTPGTPQNAALLADLDDVALSLRKLADAGVPVLWRPYHEMNGGWFWWGRKSKFITLWNLMFDHFTKTHKLNNILWVWSPNADGDGVEAQEAYYPGGARVDILALDIYNSEFKDEFYNRLWDLGRGKLIAIGENGKLPSPALLAKSQRRWSYLMTWGKLLYESNTESAIKDFMNASFTINRSEYTKALAVQASKPEGSPPVPVSGLRGEYFNNMVLSGMPALVRTDANINFVWRQGSPDPAIGVDFFSVRWNGRLSATYSEGYTVYSSSDDGIRIWIDGQLVIDSWIKQSGQERKGIVNLIAGKLHDIKVEFYENQGDARAVLMWESPSQVKEVIPAAAFFLP
ncbi:glycosyl hydrolase [Paenibacillus sp. NPDC056722]|uniref:glycosyl hydrolase n=1 Tax=Paenibacillus sp. NPDC056722 TaxID=3345924 RepID=UPI00369EF193